MGKQRDACSSLSSSDTQSHAWDGFAGGQWKRSHPEMGTPSPRVPLEGTQGRGLGEQQPDRGLGSTESHARPRGGVSALISAQRMGPRAESCWERGRAAVLASRRPRSSFALHRHRNSGAPPAPHPGVPQSPGRGGKSPSEPSERPGPGAHRGLSRGKFPPSSRSRVKLQSLTLIFLPKPPSKGCWEGDPDTFISQFFFFGQEMCVERVRRGGGGGSRDRKFH